MYDSIAGEAATEAVGKFIIHRPGVVWAFG